MKKFPLFASINPKIFSNDTREGNIHFLRNKILHSNDLLKYSNWTKGGFLKSVNRGKVPFKRKYFSILCVSIKYDLDDILVYLDSGETLLLIEVINDLVASEYPLAVIFLYCEENHKSVIESILGNYRYTNLCIFLSSNDERKFLFALACELINWWELASSRVEDVTFMHLLKCIKAVVNNYERCTHQDSFQCTIIDLATQISGLAWSKGKNYCLDTDIDKILNNARNEQIGDAIKRVFDKANHPREEHSTPDERLISSQGLFWLSEIEDLNDVEEWIVDTRFFLDISFESHVYEVPCSITARKNLNRNYLENLIENFVTIPSGKYKFGTNKPNESEPPANPFQGYIENFKILKFPVTQELWSAIIDDSTIPNNLPIVNVNYFEAVQFAHLLNIFLNEYFPDIFDNLIVNLPSEYQWEAAARGSGSVEYPWGDSFDQDLCNCEMFVGQRTKVGEYSPKGNSTFGCEDMAGNVREWTRTYGGTKGVDWKLHTEDAYFDKNYKVRPASRMIIKGGSYSYSSECVVSWMRNTQIASRRDCQTGFRIVIENIEHE